MMAPPHRCAHRRVQGSGERIAMQVGGDGCYRGSWSPLYPQVDRWGRTGGRLFQTSLSILTLEVYYRYLPLYRSFDEDQEKPDTAMKVGDTGKPKSPNPDAGSGSFRCPETSQCGGYGVQPQDIGMGSLKT